jgi:hypothetical protein
MGGAYVAICRGGPLPLPRATPLHPRPVFLCTPLSPCFPPVPGGGPALRNNGSPTEGSGDWNGFLYGWEGGSPLWAQGGTPPFRAGEPPRPPSGGPLSYDRPPAMPDTGGTPLPGAGSLQPSAVPAGHPRVRVENGQVPPHVPGHAPPPHAIGRSPMTPCRGQAIRERHPLPHCDDKGYPRCRTAFRHLYMPSPPHHWV